MPKVYLYPGEQTDMAPRIIDGWDEPIHPLNHKWTWVYTRCIGKIELKISTDEEPQTKFDGHIFDKYNQGPPERMYIYYDDDIQNWICRDDARGPRPVLDNEIKTMEELADFMVAKAREIEASRNA